MQTRSDSATVAGGGSDHWSRLARSWELSGPPLRVSAEDLDAYSTAVEGWGGERAPRALLLGVTPELYGLAWPPGTDFLAADREEAMIELVWPGPAEQVVREDWTELSLADGSRDIVLCDGGFHLLDHPAGQAGLVTSLARVVAEGGLCLLRLFVPPARPEDPVSVTDDLTAGRISSVNVLKLRLGMALQTSPAAGVELGLIWSVFDAALADRDAERATGWSPEELGSMDAYRASRSRYHFVEVEAVRRLFCESPGGFALESVTTPRYELGERCPLVVLRRIRR